MVKGKQVKAFLRQWWPPFVVSLVLLGGVTLWTRDSPVFVDSSYWNMAVSLIRDGDLFLLDGEPKMALTEFHLTTKGHLATPHFAGSGLIAVPFLALGEALIPIFHPEIKFEWNASSGYGSPDHYRLSWYNASVLVCGLSFLLLMYSLCRKFTNPLVAAIAVISILFSTQLWRMLWFSQGGAELVALLFVAVMLRILFFLDEQRTLPPTWGILVGLSLGLATFARLQSVVWGILALFFVIRWWRTGRLRANGIILAGVLAAGSFVLAILPQLLVYRTWFGVFLLDPYGGFVVGENLLNVISLLPHHSGFITVSLIPILGLVGIFFFPHRHRELLIGFMAIVLVTLVLIVIRAGIELHLYLGSRYNLVLTPIFMLGVAAFLHRLPRYYRGIAVLLVLVLVNIVFIALLQRSVPGGFPPELRLELEMLPGGNSLSVLFIRAIKAIPFTGRILFQVIGGPKAAGSWLVAVGLLPAFIIIGLVLAKKKRSLYPLALFILLVMALFNLIFIGLAVKSSEDTVALWEREGRFDTRWRTLGFDWVNCTDWLFDRAHGYLRGDQYGEATRLALTALAIKPIREGQLPDLVMRLRGDPQIGLSLWQELYDRYAVTEAISELSGLEIDDAARDGNVRTVVLPAKKSPQAIMISLNRDKHPFSDVVVIFAESSGIDNIKAEVSSNGKEWQKPFRIDRWEDLLWIWDFHQRPWRYIRLSGFETPEEASIREIFAIFSPRHSR